jgi:HAD superfamily hydrolase (TIGR01509 family)
MTACVVFDFDGTVIDTEEPSFLTWQELWADHGLELSLADWQSSIGTHNRVFDPWDQLQARLGRTLGEDVLLARNARKQLLTDAMEPRPGVVAWLLEAERLGVPVGIASSSSVDWVEENLTRIGLRHRFEFLACFDVDVPPKPDPTSFRLACERLGADPRLSVAVEDSPNGVAAAVAAGLWTLAVPHGLTAGLDLSAADHVVTSLADLTVAEALRQARRRATS